MASARRSGRGTKARFSAQVRTADEAARADWTGSAQARRARSALYTDVGLRSRAEGIGLKDAGRRLLCPDLASIFANLRMGLPSGRARPPSRGNLR